MQISGQHTLPASQQNAWVALNSIEVLKACIPGCDSLSETEPGRYEVLITAAVGPVKAKFKGKLGLSDINPPESYTINFEGQGGAAGHGEGSAKVRLENKGLNQSLLHYTADASVGGKIAQIGQRLVDMTAKKMAAEFFDNFNRQILLLYPPDPAPLGTTVAEAGADQGVQSGLWPRLQSWLRSLLDKR
jgi:carbon monoxide dehydrogenase subunit G